jgi:hypothetical protein
VSHLSVQYAALIHGSSYWYSGACSISPATLGNLEMMADVADQLAGGLGEPVERAFTPGTIHTRLVGIAAS